MEEYLNNFKNKKKSDSNYADKKAKYKIIIFKILLSIIFFLISIIFTNQSDKNLLLYKEYVLTESMPFMKIKNLYENMFGEILPESKNIQPVFDEKLVFKSINDYLDGEVLEVGNNALINSLSSGVVVFVGNKEGYGKTVIIQGIDGYDIWYGNLDNININLYDYIEKNTVIGDTIDNQLYIVIKKDNDYIKYEDYQN